MARVVFKTVFWGLFGSQKQKRLKCLAQAFGVERLCSSVSLLFSVVKPMANENRKRRGVSRDMDLGSDVGEGCISDEDIQSLLKEHTKAHEEANTKLLNDVAVLVDKRTAKLERTARVDDERVSELESRQKLLKKKAMTRQTSSPISPSNSRELRSKQSLEKTSSLTASIDLRIAKSSRSPLQCSSRWMRSALQLRPSSMISWGSTQTHGPCSARSLQASASLSSSRSYRYRRRDLLRRSWERSKLTAVGGASSKSKPQTLRNSVFDLIAMKIPKSEHRGSWWQLRNGPFSKFTQTCRMCTPAEPGNLIQSCCMQVPIVAHRYARWHRSPQTSMRSSSCGTMMRFRSSASTSRRCLEASSQISSDQRTTSRFGFSTFTPAAAVSCHSLAVGTWHGNGFFCCTDLGKLHRKVKKWSENYYGAVKFHACRSRMGTGAYLESFSASS